MGLLSVVVLNRLSDQVDRLNTLNRQASQARDMIYGVTLQSHFRAMALVTLDDVDEPYTPRIGDVKEEFANDVAEMRTYGTGERDTPARSRRTR